MVNPAHANILLVEDDEDIVELVRYNLEKQGYNVTSVMSGEDGLDIARKLHPDLLLLDLMLPGVDGLLVCRILKEDANTRDIPIIIITAKGEAEDIAAGRMLGADDYIVKPFSLAELISRIHFLLFPDSGQGPIPKFAES